MCNVTATSILQSADRRISTVEVVIEAARWARPGPTAASRHCDGRGHGAEQGPNNGNAIVPTAVVRIAHLADSGGVALLACNNRVVTVIIAEGLGKNWRRAENQRNRGSQEVLNVTSWSPIGSNPSANDP